MLTPWKESYDQHRQHIKKQKHYFANKGPSSQGCGFSSSHVWLWELDCKESWVPKNWCYWTVVLEKTLWVPWTARRSNQSILKEISPEYSLEGLMLKLKLQYFGHLMQRADSFEKTLILGKIEGGRSGDDRGWDYWIASLTQWTWVWVNSGSLWWTGGLMCCSPWGRKESYTTDLLNWTELNCVLLVWLFSKSSHFIAIIITWLNSGAEFNGCIYSSKIYIPEGKWKVWIAWGCVLEQEAILVIRVKNRCQHFSSTNCSLLVFSLLDFSVNFPWPPALGLHLSASWIIFTLGLLFCM